MIERRISLITMGQANPMALKRTLESFKGIVGEVVYGDVLIFDEDREVVKSYQDEYNLRIMQLPFNYIFQMGFANTLNFLISNAKNDMVLYMNTSEVIDENYGINEIINNNPDCNSFYFSHRVEKHRWFRCFDRREIQWSGRLHEEPRGEERPYHKPIFQMADTEKDLDNQFKAAVANSVKEMCYWQQLIKIVDNPKLKEATNEHWINFAKEQYDSMKKRLEDKGNQYKAFQLGDFEMFLHDIYTSNYFNETKFESIGGLNFQGARKEIL
jgi:hypothetical protein